MKPVEVGLYFNSFHACLPPPTCEQTLFCRKKEQKTVVEVYLGQK